MKNLIHTCGSQSAVHNAGKCLNSCFQEALKPGTDYIERQKENQSHNADENGDRGILSGQYFVYPAASCVLAAFSRLFDA